MAERMVAVRALRAWYGKFAPRDWVRLTEGEELRLPTSKVKYLESTWGHNEPVIERVVVTPVAEAKADG
jgi:hypothetical protein